MIPEEISKPVREFMATNKWAIIITIVAIVIGFVSIIYMGKDNPIEQEAEKLIEIETGVKLDLTPSNNN